MGHPIVVEDATFDEEVTKSSTPVVVDFWADWCGPCKMVAPIIEDLAEEMGDKVKFAKVDVDSNPKVAMQFSIRSIPTLLIFKDGKPVGQVVGALPKAVLKKRVEDAIA
jgi:thioredoxin 1